MLWVGLVTLQSIEPTKTIEKEASIPLDGWVGRWVDG
jgi:hypothetical protein